MKKRVNGAWVTTSPLKYGTSTDTLTTLPADIYANDTTATVGLKGDMSQTGTPTPTTPIQPQECGDLTGNLCDESTLQNGYFNTTTYQYYPNENYRCFSMSLSAGTYTIFAKSDSLTIRLLRVSSASLGANAVNLDNQAYTFTLSATETIYVSMRNSTTTNDFTGLTIMLNTGDRALSYEPYGQYKIPILNNSQTTNVYLGEVQSTRRIKKLVLTGNEPVYSTSASTSEQGTTLFVYTYSNLSMNDIINEGASMRQIDYPQFLSNSFIMKTERLTDWKNTNNGELSAQSSNSGNNNFVIFGSNQYSTTEDFKAYLQQRYASGNPVTIYYILATPTTGIVNEPLRKIGDYTDTVSDITIPTISGANSFDVLTTLKPSEVSLAYTGWHDATVKEWDGSEWQ